jgi:hypothetical protein
LDVRRLLSIMVTLFLAGMLHLASPALADTWFCDFEAAADAELWTPDDEGPRTGKSEWEIDGGWFHQTATEEMYHKAAAGSSDWTDYTVEFDMCILEGPRSCAGVLLRSDSAAANGYRLWMHDEGAFQFTTWQDNEWKVHIIRPPFTPEQGKEYHMKVSIEGWTVSAWVDGEPIIEGHEIGNDMQFFESGMLGLINYGCHVRYDNIEVSGPNVRSLLVEPHSRLATTWGWMKLGA